MPAAAGPRASSRHRYTAAERAALPPTPIQLADRGFTELERAQPGRWREISLHALDLSDPAGMPLGQLGLTMADLGLAGKPATAYGFTAATQQEAAQLRVAWLLRLTAAELEASSSKPLH